MLGITYDTAKEHNLIRFPHASEPRDLFFLEPGKDIVIHNSNPLVEDRTIACKPVHEGEMYHFYCGSNCFHINEFAERMAQNGNTYEPALPIEDLSLFEKKYLDRDLTDADGKPLPYFVIWCNNGAFLHSETWFDRQTPEEDRLAICVNPAAEPERMACIINGKYEKDFMSLNDMCWHAEQISMEGFEKKQIMESARQAERLIAKTAPVPLANRVADAQQRVDNARATDSAPAIEQGR